MAHFYGTISGSRGEASRLGTKDSGLYTTAASWAGRVDVRLYECDGVDRARISLAVHHGHGVNQPIYDGPVGVLDTLGLAPELFANIADDAAKTGYTHPAFAAIIRARNEPVQVEAPWHDMKVAYGIEDPDKFTSALDRQRFALPTGWELCEVDGAGARYVAVFRINVLPTVNDGKIVEALVAKWGT